VTGRCDRAALRPLAAHPADRWCRVHSWSRDATTRVRRGSSTQGHEGGVGARRIGRRRTARPRTRRDRDRCRHSAHESQELSHSGFTVQGVSRTQTRY
jgi:hypothetical protein